MLEKLQEHEGEEALKRKGKEMPPRDQDGGSAPGLEPTCHRLLEGLLRETSTESLAQRLLLPSLL